MRLLLISQIISISIVVGLDSFAQQPTIKDNLKQIDSSFKQIKDLFKKKEKSEDKPQSTINTNVKAGQESQQLKAGDIHPNVKYIDFEYTDAFSHGVAVIRKGQSSALIDAKGNFIFPYNMYRVTYRDPVNGFISLQNEYGYESIVNARGKILYKHSEDGFVGPDKGTAIQVTFNNKKGFVYIDTSGKRHYHEVELSNINERIGIIAEKENNLIVGYKYKTLEGKLLNNNLYNEADPFHDGMAIVGKRNEFGEIKYGFINTTGREITGFVYSQKPYRFMNGCAVVRPKSESSVAYAVINKQGKQLFQVLKDDIKRLISYECFMSKNIAVTARGVIDTAGNFSSVEDFLSRYGITAAKTGLHYAASYINRMDPDEIIWYFGDIKRRYTGFGWFNTKTGKNVSPIFLSSTPEMYFDKGSRLCYVRTYLGTDEKGKELWREGYVNEDGVFVMMRKQQSDW
jgi:WG containing repeat